MFDMFLIECVSRRENRFGILFSLFFFSQQSRWMDDGLFKFDYLMMMRNVSLSLFVSVAIRKIDPEHWTMRRMCNWSFIHAPSCACEWRAIFDRLRAQICWRVTHHVRGKFTWLRYNYDDRWENFVVVGFFNSIAGVAFFTYCRKLYPFRFFLRSLEWKKNNGIQ